ncbi:MAG TPA: cation-translocating P-type ATPase [Psychromonas sp.]
MINEITAPPITIDSVPLPHTQSAQEVINRLKVEHQVGLSGVLAKERYYQDGPNRLPEAPARSAWSVFLIQFRSILIIILLAAVLLSALIGNIKDAVVILVVVLINTSMGFYQEYRAERSLAALKDMLPVKTHVKRDGQKIEIPVEQLVPGDLVLLEAGDLIPADGRLLIAAGLEIDESALTGESQPVAKNSSALLTFDAPLGDRINMVYMNTILTKGRAEFVVTATGIKTEMGLLSEELAATKESPTPLQIQLDILAKRLAVIALTLVGLMALLELMRGTQLSLIILKAIALAVAAIPEGLPLVVTVTLSLGMHQMARQRAIVKRLASVETLGCTTVICSDKTGTLTLNQMTARSFYYQGERFKVTGEGYKPEGTISTINDNTQKYDLKPLLIPLIACNDSYVNDAKVVGDPMEAALLILAHKGGMSCTDINKRLPRMAEIPFDSAHKFMVTFHRIDDQVQLFIKGAPDALLPFCAYCYAENGEQLLSTGEREKIDAEYLVFAEDGLRGLLIATRLIPLSEFNSSGDLTKWVNKLTFISLLGLLDPPRPEAKEAIKQCGQAGITVKMITGDHKTTGTAIAKELGLEGSAVTGAELDLLDSTMLAAVIEQTVCFARVNPVHKVKIVRALQSKGHVVAMTGDGVNDAPALKSADIGVAMGITGSAVAKEAATMVLVDDNFATIVLAVHQGRTLYDNILKFVRFQLSTTIGAILTVFFAPLLGLPEPFTAIQILWIAIIMDGPPAVSLALDAGRLSIMSEPPRRRAEPILPISLLLKITTYGITMMVGTLAVLYFALQTGTEQRALTLAFSTFVLFQVFNVFNARNEFGSAFNPRLFSNIMLWTSLTAVVILQALAVHWSPAKMIFGTGGMVFSDWIIAYAVAASILALEEGRKFFVRLYTR